MQSLVIGPNEAGQRLDKFLRKYLKTAPSSFLYRMMRKKNIELNGAKCEGNEILKEGDRLCLFFSADTLEKFGAMQQPPKPDADYGNAFASLKGIEVLYEDPHILVLQKPAGILSQKAEAEDLSLSEWLVGYLLKTKALSPSHLATFRPSVCNRLDRNTGGIVLCGKSLEGLHFLTELIRRRLLTKEYRFLCLGELKEEGRVNSWLVKEKRENRACIYDAPLSGAQQISTFYCPLTSGYLPGCGAVTDGRAELITGKSHQIRAQLSHMGHPLLGDPKYGDRKSNQAAARYGVKAQMLYAWRIRFPESMPEKYDGFSYLAQKTLTALLPEPYRAVLANMAGAGGRQRGKEADINA